MKKYLKIILTLCLILSIMSAPSYALTKNAAADEMVIRPMFTYINVMSNYIDINRNGKATVTATLSTTNEVDQVEVEVQLQQYDINSYSWKTIKTWSDFDDGCIAVAGGTWYVKKGYLYRAVAYGYVYINGEMVEDHKMVSQAEYYE